MAPYGFPGQFHDTSTFYEHNSTGGTPTSPNATLKVFYRKERIHMRGEKRLQTYNYITHRPRSYYVMERMKEIHQFIDNNVIIARESTGGF